MKSDNASNSEKSALLTKMKRQEGGRDQIFPMPPKV